MKIHRPNPQSLIVTSLSRLESIAFFSIGLAVFGLLFWAFFKLGTISDGTNLFEHIKYRLSTSPALWIFVLAVVLLLPFMYIMLKKLSDELSFDGIMRTISKNEKPVAKFSEVEHLRIRTIKYEGGATHYLTAVLRSGKEIKIRNCGYSDEIVALADDIADIVKVSVIQKKKKPLPDDKSNGDLKEETPKRTYEGPIEFILRILGHIDMP